MTSPSEPGYPRTGDRPGSGTNGSGSEGGGVGNVPRPTGNITETGEVPPWQRGKAARPAEPRQDSGRSSGSHSAGVEARLQRFVSGGEATEAEPPRQRPEPTRPEPSRPEPPRTEAPRSDASRSEPGRTEAYASELPDLSGPTPRPPQRKAAEAPAASRSSSSGATSRIQVASRTSTKGPLRASMQIRRVDPWTVLKVALVLSSALFFVWMIAVAFLYLVLGGMGVWSKLNSNVGDLLTSSGGNAGGELVSSGTIFGGAALIGLVNIVVLTAMATIGAFIYNLTTDLVGGIEVTLADRD
ncbi:DUF3566 domain-containing protein [Mycolicibacterium brisbanense]|uniref:DUF3566 domain-containing protein n=1 Tax=Mycolicibacterium brisbanense TaxID=146020 RepID=A0A100VYK4_9MYCO|nr:DUF3566 domain-containing protein [Mycolicibacterium brisbanense]MCV7161112.1 DUF3566 domain-containing protein [Mycolicibacterium brisbanense]GAS88296.1 transmembrane domain of unknown function [Mycolicibacterium brisbanense]